MMTYVALEQAVYAALTTPPFQYTDRTGATQTLPAANIMTGEPVDVPDPKPDPLVTFAIGGKGKVSPSLPFRKAEIRISVSTGLPYGSILVGRIYAVILDRLESKDAEGRNPISRVATSTTLALTAVTIEEVDKRAAAFDKDSQRFYIGAQLNVIAQ
jgi:hypothetical protein